MKIDYKHEVTDIIREWLDFMDKVSGNIFEITVVSFVCLICALATFIILPLMIIYRAIRGMFRLAGKLAKKVQK